MTVLPWTPGFGYGSSELRLSLPMRPWRHISATVGGRRVSATGIPAAYQVRRDSILEITPRIWEHEWLDVLDMIAFGQAGGVITFTPDISRPAETYEIYLDSPEMGEDVVPERDEGIIDLLTLSLRIRTVDGSPWALTYMHD